MENNFYIDAYLKYRDKLHENDFSKTLPIMPYDCIQKPKSDDGIIFIYTQLLSEYTGQLANDINSFRRNLCHLNAWNNVIQEYEDKEKYYLIIEFVEALTVLLHDFPYSIKNRFIFSLSHLCHQSNRYVIDGWKDDVCEDRKINYKTMTRRCSNWKYFDFFKDALSSLFSDEYNTNTNNYRNNLHHRIPIHTEIGLSNFVTRNIDGSRVSYNIGDFEPISLSKTINLMEQQHSSMCECFEKYKKLLEHQVNVINEMIGTDENE